MTTGNTPLGSLRPHAPVATATDKKQKKYYAKRLNQIVLASGVLFKPTNGVFVPETEEQVKLLEYYDKQGLDYVTTEEPKASLQEPQEPQE